MSKAFDHIQRILANSDAGINLPAPVKFLCTDSRQISFPEETMFIALVTSKRDGHHYLPHAYKQGVRFFLVSKWPPQTDTFEDAHWIKVPDTLKALQLLATYKRELCHYPVVGITGSNGKTIVKEWLNQLLQLNEKVVRSPKSYNSQIGVALSVWQMEPAHTLGIFEAGISTLGEMENLEAMIKPSIGIFTNLGAAHDEGFESRAQKLAEKWKLFSHAGRVICCSDNREVIAYAHQMGTPLFTWGYAANADVKIVTSTPQSGETLLSLDYNGMQMEANIPFTDAASLENAMHVIALCLYLRVPLAQLKCGLDQLHPLNMRLEWKKGLHASLLLNDSYSHDLTSLPIALNQLKQQAGNGRMMSIISDLPGVSGSAYYRQMAEMMAEHGVQHMIGIGPFIQQYSTLFIDVGVQTEVFDSTEDFLLQFDRRQIGHTTILIKGGRLFGFERIVNALQQQQHETCLEINLSALYVNLNAYRQLLGPGTAIMVMLKAFGYGSTDAELGRWLQHNGIDYLAVAYADEGVALREGGVHLPIMVMNPEPASFEVMGTHKLEPELFSFDILQAFIQYCEGAGLQRFPVHIKLDTGMHRLGFLPHEIEELATLLSRQTCLEVKTAFTHLVASENPLHDNFTINQATLFDEGCATLEQYLAYRLVRHAANSAAIARHPSLHYDMVRLGIGLFGISTTDVQYKLQSATTLYTTIAQVKQVPAGQSVGYSKNAILQRDSLIATVRIGYADGYPRMLSNGVGRMVVHGQKAPVIGNVCMDMTMLDVTDISNVRPGDRVEVFGEHVSVSELAQQCDTIPYEIMTGINRRVKRVMVEE